MDDKKDDTILPMAPGDVWDDKLLIKAYDTSVKLAKEDLAKRIANATNRAKVAPEENQISGNCDNSGDAVVEFKMGDYARATFDDGRDYEAKILSLNKEEGTCILQYIGYGNKQEVAIADLVPSFGKQARRLQFERAREEEQEKDSVATAANIATSKKGKNRPFVSIPPPPPMPPMLEQNLEESEHLSAMLMSWYMSGYYTGVYQGIQMGKRNKKLQK